MAAINVLIVDDSAVVRQAIAAALAADASIRVLAAVADPILALRRMRVHWPDVIVLDIEMPRMDGITFLRQLMAERPTPVVICSSLTTRGASTTMQALSAGAVAIVAKPQAGARGWLLDAAADLVRAVRAAAHVNLRSLRAAATGPPIDPLPSAFAPLAPSAPQVVAIGTSTGGTQALEAILTALPRATPGIVIVQHMPQQFTAAFAQRLDDLSRIEVREARDGDAVLPGRALIAPGGRHMTLRRSGAQYVVQVRDGPLVHHHRPSVDVLFRSVAEAAGAGALGIIMTGMGADGALGLQAMHQAGARTVAQDEATSVVFGMPKEAIKLGAVDSVLPLQELPHEILRMA